MNGRQELAQRLEDWLRAKNWTPRRLSLDAGLPENAVKRILERPERDTQPETWRKLAQYLKWDERDTLALAGHATAPEPSDDPEGQLDRLLRQMGLRGRYLEHIRFQIEVLKRACQLESNGEPSR
jgi:hypothetical protein